MVPIPSSSRGWNHSPLSEPYSALDTPRLFQVEVVSDTQDSPHALPDGPLEHPSPVGVVAGVGWSELESACRAAGDRGLGGDDRGWAGLRLEAVFGPGDAVDGEAVGAGLVQGADEVEPYAPAFAHVPDRGGGLRFVEAVLAVA